MLLLLLFACQEPFSVERHDLGPFRVAALGVVDGQARAAVWSGEGLFYDEAPRLEWSLDGAPLGEGFEVPVPGPGRLGLVATSPDGAVEAAEVTVTEAPAPFEITRAAVSLGEDLSLDARAQASARPLVGGEAAAIGEAVRLVAAAPDTHRLRWMTAQGLGTSLELDAHTVDHLGEEVVFDDGLVDSRTELAPQVYTLLALAIDGEGGNRWRWIDVAIGTTTPLSPVGGHLLDLGAALAPGLYSVEVSEADDLRGLRFSDPQPVPDVMAEMTPPCADPATAFDPAWLIEGRCLRGDVIGLRLILDVQ